MKRRFLIRAAVFSTLGALGQNVASAAPTPSYDVTCVVGGQTTATWSRAKLDQATLAWFGAGSTTPYTSVTVPLSPHPPRGFIVSSAGTGLGVTPATVRVSFEHADGSGTDHVEMPCS